MSTGSTGLSDHETPRAGGIGHNRGPPLEPLVYTLDQVAQRLNLGRNTVYEHARTDTLPVKVIRVGRRMMVSRAALDRFLNGEAA